METATAILKDLLLPQLEKDAKYRSQENPEIFWAKFTVDFLDYESDPKPVFAAVYRFELEDPERIIKKLPSIHNTFIEQLAEQYVLGKESEAINTLKQNDNGLFQEHVVFFRELKNAITLLERRRMIDEMPAAYAALSEEISDESIQAVIKKKGREDLRAKFNAWDEEIDKEKAEELFIGTNNSMSYIPPDVPEKEREKSSLPEKARRKPDSSSYSWMYAVAAILLIGFFIWQPTQKSNTELFNSYAGSEEVLSEINFSKFGGTADAVATRGGEFRLSGYTKGETEQALEAISLFQQQEFNSAKNILEELNPRGKNEDLLFFLAVSRLNSGEIDKAVQELEFLDQKPNYPYEEEVEFYLALGYLKKGNESSAKTLLEELKNSAGKFARQAGEILKDMRWF